ncbi:MAG: carbohydrate binding domain-containing protein [Bacillota bacterium]
MATIDLGSQARLEACFNDGKGNWDSRNGANYFFEPGVWTFNAGQILKGAPGQQ